MSDQRENELDEIRRKARSLYRNLQFAKKWLVASYCALGFFWLVYAVLAWRHSSDEFERSGAGLILLATVLSVVHLMTGDRAKRFFDPLVRVPNTMIDGALVMPFYHERDGTPVTVTKLSNRSLGMESSIISAVIQWEVAFATIGTFVWGYGEWLYCISQVGSLQC